jgi:4-nitrophenyl phosphatase
VGQRPLLTGKPNPFIIDEICAQNNIDKKDCLMVGDNLETDILFGVNASIDTLLVLTGVTN